MSPPFDFFNQKNGPFALSPVCCIFRLQKEGQNAGYVGASGLEEQRGRGQGRGGAGSR